MIGESSFHRGRYAQGLMYPAEVVIHKVQGSRGLKGSGSVSIIEVIGGCPSPPEPHSALEHALDAGIHLGFVDYVSPICLFDPSANTSAEAIILIDKPQSGIYHESVWVFVQMRRDLR
jgi:hypothetical protein